MLESKDILVLSQVFKLDLDAAAGMLMAITEGYTFAREKTQAPSEIQNLHSDIQQLPFS
jgi:hypothetical protein